jgi:signal peptidase I
LGEVKRNDIVVFNFPAGDTVALNMQAVDFYTLSKYNATEVRNQSRQTFLWRRCVATVDRRENYVKRCIGMPAKPFNSKMMPCMWTGNLFRT